MNALEPNYSEKEVLEAKRQIALAEHRIQAQEIANAFIGKVMNWRIWRLAEHRHRGLARRPLDHARTEVSAMGHDRLSLVTDLEGFCEKCGWEYVGEVNELDGAPIRLYGADVLLH